MGFAMRSPSRCKDAQSIRFVFAKPMLGKGLGYWRRVRVVQVPWEQGNAEVRGHYESYRCWYVLGRSEGNAKVKL